MKEVKVLVIGEPKSGKSVVSGMIYNLFKEAGFAPELFDDGEVIINGTFSSTQQREIDYGLKGLLEANAIIRVETVDSRKQYEAGKEFQEVQKKQLEEIVSLRKEIKLLKEGKVKNFKAYQELEDTVEGLKTLAKVESARKLYYKRELAAAIEAKINLSVTLDLGLQNG